MIVMGESMVSCNFTGNQSNEIALGGSPSFRQTNVAETSSWLWKKGWWKCETRVPTVAREVFKDVKLHVPLAVIPKHSTFRMIPPPRASYASDLGQKMSNCRSSWIPRSIHQTSVGGPWHILFVASMRAPWNSRILMCQGALFYATCFWVDPLS